MTLSIIQDIDLFWYCVAGGIIAIAICFLLAHLESKKFKNK